jgi:hypothetical protein
MIKWTEDARAGGTSLRGYLHGDFKAQKIALKLASGQSGKCDGDGKVTIEFIGTCNGKVFTLYDWKGGRMFHIGGNDDLNLTQLGRDLAAFGAVNQA